MNRQRFAEIQAIKSNSAYMESQEGLNISIKKIEQINTDFNSMIKEIRDPGSREREIERVRKTPLFAAGIRGFERMKSMMEDGINPLVQSNG